MFAVWQCDNPCFLLPTFLLCESFVLYIHSFSVLQGKHNLLVGHRMWENGFYSVQHELK